MIYEIVIHHRWFLHGKPYDQRIGVTTDLEAVPYYILEFLRDNPQFKNHSIGAHKLEAS